MLSTANIATVFKKELRELLRDRRSLMVMFGVPLLLYPLLFAGIGKLAQGKQQQQALRQATLILVNADDAPELLRRLSLPDYRLKIEQSPPDDARLQRGEVDAILIVPPNAEALLLSPPPPTTPATQSSAPEFEVRLDRSRTEADSTDARLRQVFATYERWIIEQRLAGKGVAPDILTGLKRNTTDIATQDQRLGRFLAQLLPLLLLVTGMLGAFFPALNATTTERELGTLETLLVTPVNRTELLLAKGLLVLACAILTAGLNMVSMSLVFANIAGSAREQLGTVSINPAGIALAFLATIPALVLFSSIVMCVGLIARTYREANSFAAPVMMLPMAAMVVAMVDPATTHGLLMTPVANTTLIIRDILTDRITLGAFALAAGSNLLFAAVVLSVAARLFTNEQLVNPSWEPLSLKGFRRRGQRPKRFPTVDEALLLIAVGLLIQFYAGPWFGRLLATGHLNPLTLVTLLLTSAFLLPTLLLTFLARYDAPKVLALPLPPAPARSLTASLLLGLGLAPLMVVLVGLQNLVFPSQPTDAARSLAEIIGQSLQLSPVLAVLTFGLVPGLCEELLFRGVVLSSLKKRLPAHAAVWITAVLFAAAHLDAPGMLPRTLLGAALGYLVLRTGSVWTAVLLHAAYNGLSVAVVAFHAPADFGSLVTEQTIAALEPLGTPSLLRAAVGTALALAALALLRTTPKPAPAS